MNMHTQSTRLSVMQLALRDKGALYAAYIPWFADGGIFISTTREFRLGDDAYVLLTLPGDPQRYPIAGTVGWITPAGAGGTSVQGVGVRFSADAHGVQVKTKIEQMLGAALGSDRPTLTL